MTRSNETTLVALVRALIICADSVEMERLQTQCYYHLAAKFYDRCHKVAAKLYTGIPDWKGKADEIFQDTFILLFQEIKGFTIGDNWNDEECQKVLLNWMGKVANNKFLKTTSTLKEEKEWLPSFHTLLKIDLRSGVEGERKSYRQTYDKAKFEKFYLSLNPMAREILLKCIDEGTLKEDNSDFISSQEVELLKKKNDIDSCARPKDIAKYLEKNKIDERNTDHLSDETIEHFTTKYKVKSPAIRKAKQRALEGLRNCKI